MFTTYKSPSLLFIAIPVGLCRLSFISNKNLPLLLNTRTLFNSDSETYILSWLSTATPIGEMNSSFLNSSIQVYSPVFLSKIWSLLKAVSTTISLSLLSTAMPYGFTILSAVLPNRNSPNLRKNPFFTPISSGLSIAPSYIILAGSGGGGHRRGLESASCPCMEGVVEQPAKNK